MALVPRTGRTRLVQVVATDGRYPFYGGLETQPANRWSALSDPRTALVDPALLIELGAEVGDSLKVGDVTFRIAAAVTNSASTKPRPALNPKGATASRIVLANTMATVH